MCNVFLLQLDFERLSHQMLQLAIDRETVGRNRRIIYSIQKM